MDSQWLTVQFSHNPRKTKADLAKVLGLEPSAVSKMLSGDRQIKAGEYIIMRRFFGMPVEEDVNRLSAPSVRSEGQPKTDSGLQESLTMPANEGWTQPRPPPSSMPPSMLGSSKRFDTNLKVALVRDEHMAPALHTGEHVLVNTDDNHPDPEGVFLISDGFHEFIRLCTFIEPGSKSTVRIQAYNKDFHAQILDCYDIEIIGRVLAKLQAL